MAQGATWAELPRPLSLHLPKPYTLNPQKGIDANLLDLANGSATVLPPPTVEIADRLASVADGSLGFIV